MDDFFVNTPSEYFSLNFLPAVVWVVDFGIKMVPKRLILDQETMKEAINAPYSGTSSRCDTNLLSLLSIVTFTITKSQILLRLRVA